MTLPRLNDMASYWEHSPPMHIMAGLIGAAIGIDLKKLRQEAGTVTAKPPKKIKPKKNLPGSLARLKRDFAAVGGRVR